MYVGDLGDRRGATLKFRFRTRSAWLRGEVGGWKYREKDWQYHVLYAGGRECGACTDQVQSVQEWEGAAVGGGGRDGRYRMVVEIGWGRESEGATGSLGETDMTDEFEADIIDRGVKKYLRKVMDKRRRWMGQGNGLWPWTYLLCMHMCVYTRWPYKAHVDSIKLIIIIISMQVLWGRSRFQN